jgi:hypothetical protein
MDQIELLKLVIEAIVAFTSTFAGVFLSMRIERQKEKKNYIERGKNLLRYVIAELEQINTVLISNRALSETLNRNYSFRSFAIDSISFEQMEVFSPILGTRLLMFREELKEIKQCIKVVRTKNQNVDEANPLKIRWNNYRETWMESIKIINKQIEEEFPNLIPKEFFKEKNDTDLHKG